MAELKTVQERMTPERYAERWLVTGFDRPILEKAKQEGRDVLVKVAYIPFGAYAMGIELAEEECYCYSEDDKFNRCPPCQASLDAARADLEKRGVL